ncbi:hypothetical protein [Pseudomonas protegens]|uniref:hypothetical protein n=1 Tax=Pseudomonas protegens TaxID=380021 RepID=UPI002745D667|nr:hypothetical protein [Pseudomonas protegens]MDP9528484.1 hypothetical protein [Pseudomonas protegens]
MSITPVNIGSAPNDGTGQTLRSGGQVINANFAELDTRTAAAQAKANQGVADAAAARTVADAAVPGSAVGSSVAQLVNGVVPASQLPSFVDDVLEFPTLANFPATGETGKIYIAVNDGDSPTNPTRQYRWSGSAFVLIPSSPGSTDQVPEGSTNQYFTAARVRSTTLAGLGALVNAAIVAGDTVLQALAKLQGQLNTKLGKSEVAADSDKLGGQPATFYTAEFVGATASTVGIKGLVPAPIAGDQLKFLRADGTYQIPIGPADVVINSNGTAVKFPDGTMIAWKEGELLTATLQYGSLYSSDQQALTFPVAFWSRPTLFATTADREGTPGFAFVGGLTTVIAYIGFYSPVAGSKAKPSYVAFGRWK